MRTSLDEARRSVWNLRAQALEEAGLAHALSRLGQQLSEGGNATFELRVDGTPRTLPADVENNLLRIGQEAITNATRHAGAARVSLTLSYLTDGVCLVVSDDGKGFDPERVQRASPPATGTFSAQVCQRPFRPLTRPMPFCLMRTPLPSMRPRRPLPRLLSLSLFLLLSFSVSVTASTPPPPVMETLLRSQSPCALSAQLPKQVLASTRRNRGDHSGFVVPRFGGRFARLRRAPRFDDQRNVQDLNLGRNEPRLGSKRWD